MNVEVLDDAEEDLAIGYVFYELQQPGLGRYFFRNIWLDMDTLRTNAGIHRFMYDKYHRLLSNRFPYAIFYRVVGETAFVHAVIDCRRSPEWIKQRLK